MSRFIFQSYTILNIMQKNKIILYWSSFQSGKGKKPASRQIPCKKKKKNCLKLKKKYFQFEIEKNYIQLNYNLQIIKFYFLLLLLICND